jgi:hypothetical protein
MLVGPHWNLLHSTPSGVQSFEVAPRFLENLCMSVLVNAKGDMMFFFALHVMEMGSVPQS